MPDRLSAFVAIRTANQVRQFVNHLVWELDLVVHEQAQGADYVDAQGHACLSTHEAAAYDALMERCWQVDACALKEAVRVETRARAVLALLQDDEFVAGHDAAGAAQEWARTSLPLPVMVRYWGAGCFEAADTDRLYRDGFRPEHCCQQVNVEGEPVPIGYAACMRLLF